ncbi:MAG: type IV pilus modification PilV family protein [Candidatus Methylomirabilales bacterium]
MRHLLREKRGLTLAEVVLAAAIISVAVLAIVGLFPTALQNVQYGGHMSQASSLAQEMIEMIRTRQTGHFADVPLYNNLDTRLPPPGGLPAPVLAHFTQWRNDIAPANPVGALPQGWGTVTVGGPPDLLQVTVTVGWRESGNPTITIVTYVARYG